MNPIRYVVDASAAIKSAVVEAHSDAWQAWVAKARRANTDLLAPPLLRYEIGNRLAREPHLSATDRQTWLEGLLLGFRFADAPDAFAHAPPLSYYDASYLSLAKGIQATLVTYDDRLLKAAKKAGIPTLSP